MKKTISIALILALLLSAIPFAYADDTTTPAEDPIVSEIIASGSLSFSGTTANCSGSVTEGGKWINATMTLSHNGSHCRQLERKRSFKCYPQRKLYSCKWVELHARHQWNR